MRASSNSLLSMLLPVPVVLFSVTLVTDIVYWQTAAMQWANISAWALLIGLVVSVLAGAAALIDFFGGHRTHAVARLHPLSTSAVLIVSIFNAFIHTRDAYTSVVPIGLVLSSLVVALMLVSRRRGTRERRIAERRGNLP